MKKLFKSWIIIMVLLSVVSCGKKERRKPHREQSITPIKVSIIDYKDISNKIIGNSILDTKNAVDLTAPSAEVKEIYVKNGDKVKKGDILLKLTDSDVEQTYLSAKATLMSAEASYEESKEFEELNVKNTFASAESSYKQSKETYDKAVRGNKKEEIAIKQADVSSAEEALKQAEFNYDKYKELYNKKLISQSDFIGYETTYKQAKANYGSAKNNLDLAVEGTDEEDIRSYKAAYESAKSAYEYAKKQVEGKSWEYTIKQSEAAYLSAQASFKQAEKDYNDLTVRAKLDGVVAGLELKKYEKTTSDTQVLLTIIDETKVEVTVGLSAEEISKLDENKKAVISIEGVEKQYKGEIVSINPSAEKSTNKFKVKISIDNKEGKLRKGMFSRITLFEKTKKCLVVPKESIVIKNLYSYIFLSENNKAKKIRVNTGLSNEKYEEIISEKVKKGDKVVVEGQFLLQDNESIKEVE